MYEIGYLSDADIEELRQANVVGDISSKYILKNGELAPVSINQRGIGIELEDLKKIDKVIGVAKGVYKVESILAALKGGYLDVLITDDETATHLIESFEEKN
jgi:DNA-binding transcriptional regulator LsrR (DeoR family)